MQYRNHKLFPWWLILLVLILAISIPRTGQAGGSFGLHIGHRGHVGFSSGHKHHRFFGHHKHRRHFGHHKHRRHFGYRKHRRHFGHHIKYGYYGHNNYYSTRRYPYYPRSYSVVSPSYAYQETPYANSQTINTHTAAWDALSQDQTTTALRIFGSEARTYPNMGIPKVGFALATASNGNLAQGLWAMRRAFRIDPNSLHQLQFDENILTTMDVLIDQYDDFEEVDGNHYDSAFMLSALYYFKQDYAAAQENIDRAKNDGDDSISLTNLEKLVRKEI